MVNWKIILSVECLPYCNTSEVCHYAYFIFPKGLGEPIIDKKLRLEKTTLLSEITNIYINKICVLISSNLFGIELALRVEKINLSDLSLALWAQSSLSLVIDNTDVLMNLNIIIINFIYQRPKRSIYTSKIFCQ